MPSVRDMRVLERARLAKDALQKSASKNWLEVHYRRSLYGGWTREDGTKAPPHKKAMIFHEASKALFCAWCEHHLGLIGSDPDETWVCEGCGNKNVLPPRDDEPGDWLLSGPSFSKHFPLTLNPYFEQAMADRIVDRIKNQQKVVTQYILDSGDKVHCLSYEQYLKAGKDQTNPYEGPRWKGALFDEPPPRAVWVATKRGLLRWMSKYTKPPFAQVYQTIFIGGGNQSLLGSSLVWDEGIHCERRIDSIDEPITVLGWDGRGLVPATAYPYDPKPAQPLIRVRLRSGRTFSGTAGHRVLDGEGRWRHLRDLVPGDTILGSPSGPRRRTAAGFPRREPPPRSFGATRGAPTDSGTPRGSPVAGLWNLGSGDGSLALGEASPQRVGASSWLGTSPDRHSCHRGMRSAWTQGADLSSPFGSHAYGTAWRSSGSHSTTAPRPTAESGLLLLSTSGSAPAATAPAPCDPSPPSSSASRLPPVGDMVESLEEIGTHVNYDLWVPGVESFVADGVIHHNSSKSYTSRSEFCARILGKRPWDGSLSMHFGRAIFAATPLESPWMFHEIYQNSWNKGGSNRSIFSIEFDITDNPALTKKAIENFSEGLSPEEREARLHGRFKHLSGRIFSEWDPEIHVYDEVKFNPLLKNYGRSDEPSSLPVIMAVDPHPRKPWFMLWVAIGPDGRKYVVDEWPNEDYFRMKYSRNGLDDYATIIRDKEAQLPGGEGRVLWREFDPNMSRTPKTVAEGSTTLVDEMRDRGLYFESDVNDKIDFGHSLIHTLLGWDTGEELSQMNRPMLYVAEKCKNLAFAFENYIWDDRNATDPERQGPVKPKDIGKDPIDALRYCLAREQEYMDWRDVMAGFEGHFNQALDDLESW